MDKFILTPSANKQASKFAFRNVTEEQGERERERKQKDGKEGNKFTFRNVTVGLGIMLRGTAPAWQM